MPIEWRPKKWKTDRGVKHDANVNEEITARDLSMIQTRGSGSQLSDKADLKSEKFRLECKQTNKLSMSIKKQWLQKVKQEADDKNQFWAMYLSFVDENNNIDNDCVIIPKELFIALKQYIGDNDV